MSIDMTPSFEADIPNTLRQILQGGTLRAGCGPHLMEQHGDGVKLSRTTAAWMLAKLEAATVKS